MVRRIVPGICAVAGSLGLALVLAWALGSAGAVAAAAPAEPVAGVLYVAPGGNCGGAAPCYASVQAAVDAASPGNEIRVAAGTYTGVSARAGMTQTLYINKTVTMRGGYTTANWTAPDPVAHPTILDAQGQGRVVAVLDAPNVTLDGLRLTGGDATGLGGGPGGRNAGGGLYAINAMSLTLSNSQVYSNSARTVTGDYLPSYGGGIYLSLSEYARLEGNTIRNNGANRAGHGNGGGLFLDRAHHLTFKNNAVRENVATTTNGGGGGLYLSDCNYATLEGNVVSDNTTSTGADAYGGGLYMANCHHASLNGNAIQGNVASRVSWGYGGGLYLHGGNNVTLQNNLIVNNTAATNPPASGWGGGLYLHLSNATLVNTVIANNRAPTAGSGLYAAGSSPQILHATIARNSGPGGGVCVDKSPWSNVYSSVALTNTIIVSHTVGVTVTQGSAVTLNATLWHANGADRDGAGTINHSNDHSGDPAFKADGYHLTTGSAAVDRGVASGVKRDIDGQPRPQGAGYDLGVDEFGGFSLYLPLIRR